MMVAAKTRRQRETLDAQEEAAAADDDDDDADDADDDHEIGKLWRRRPVEASVLHAVVSQQSEQHDK